jgi:competence protein ComEC
MQSWMMGLVSGIVLAGFWPALPPWPILLVFAGVAIAAHIRPTPLMVFTGGLALGSALGMIHGTQLLQSRIVAECVGMPVTVKGTVSSLPRVSQMPDRGRMQRFEMMVAELLPQQCEGPQKILLSYYGEQTIAPGDEWQFEVKLKKPWGLANPGVFNLQAWFAQNGVDAVGSVRESGKTQQRLAQAVNIWSLPDRLRQKINEHIGEQPLTAESAAILRAVTVADGSGIEPKLWFLLQQFGLSHLLVVSGTHVTMVAAAGFILGAVCLRLLAPLSSRLRWLPGAAAILSACFYGALAGLTLPVQRALCMLFCFVLAGLVGRRSGAANSLLLAASVVLVLTPLAAVGSGFWLSFGAVGALVWCALWQRGLGGGMRLLQTQAAMSLFMLPLGALFFGGGSVIAMLANLLMIPLLGWVVVPLALLATVCFLGGWDVAAVLWQLAAWPLDKVLPFAHELSGVASEWLYVPLTADLMLVLLTVLSVALLAVPGRSALKLLALLLAVPMLLPVDVYSRAASQETEVTVLDVGQGTAVVVRSGRRALLYDTGGGDPEGVNMGTLAVLPFLQQQGITSLDTLIISHPDLDHSAGTAVVHNALAVGRFRYGGVATDGAGTGPLGVVGRPCVAGEAWRWPGGQVFQFLSPAQEIPRRSNDSSCVLQIEVGNYRLLLPGDIEADRERTLVQFWGDELLSDWLLAGHHGSKTSTTPTFLKRVRPQTAVISSGYANRFNHPHASVVARLQQQHVTILSTAAAGALAFNVAPGQALRISAYRDSVRRYWM